MAEIRKRGGTSNNPRATPAYSELIFSLLVSISPLRQQYANGGIPPMPALFVEGCARWETPSLVEFKKTGAWALVSRSVSEGAGVVEARSARGITARLTCF